MLSFEFRPITRGRLRRSRVSFLFVVAAALALYGVSVLPYAFPGPSAEWIAWASGLDVREVPSHPLLTAAGHWVSGVSFASLPLRLNLISVVAGALSVGWMYKLVWFFTFEMMREESAAIQASRNAQFAGLVAALAAATSLPFWEAATRFGPEMFDFALLLACASVLTVYARTEQFFWLLLFGALYGVGVAESHLFIVAAPVMIAFAVITEWKLYWCRIGRLFAGGWLSFATMLAVYGTSARSFLVAHSTVPSARAILRVIVSVWREQFDAMAAQFPEQLWVPLVVLGVGFAALAFFSAFRTLDNRRSWSLYFLSVVLTIFALVLIFNAPFSPWGIMAASGAIPAATYGVTGMGIGLLAASWRALAVLNDPVGDDRIMDPNAGDEPDDSAVSADNGFSALCAASRGTGLLLMPVLAVAVAVGGGVNVWRLRKDDGSFADRAANEVLDGLHGRKWIVSNGMLDANLLIRAHERGAVIRLLCPYRAREKNYVSFILQSVSEDASFSENLKLRAASLLSYNFHLFIDDLFATDQAIGGKAVCMGLPDVWYGSGWVPVPERLFYGGTKTEEAVKSRDLLAEAQACWKRWESFFAAKDGSPRQLSYRYRTALRRHFAFVANNLGVALGDLGRTDQAYDAYCKARAIYPDNVSALLNIFELLSRGYHPEMKDAIEHQLRQKVENMRERYPLWSLSRYYGYVRNYDLFVKMGWSWALSSTPGSVLAGLRSTYSLQQDETKRQALTSMMASLYEMKGDYVKSAAEYKKALSLDPKDTFAISGLARLALQQSITGDARKILETGEAAGAPKRLLRQDWAALYLVAGDLSRARVLLQAMADEPDASPMCLAMLAMVMIEQKEITAVETKILPRLTKMDQGGSAYFVQVIQGRIWQNKGQVGYQNARLCFHRASLLRPDVQALSDVLLMLDVALEDQKAAEAHALRILRQRPDQPYANFVMGSIRLEQGQYGDAEGYLARSTAGKNPSLEALNNYAEVLCRIRKLDDAEKIARKAVAAADGRYEGWATLAFVLAEKGNLQQAAETLDHARKINAADTRMNVVAAVIAVKRGDAAAAEKAVAAVGKVAKLSVADRREVAQLREDIAALRKKGK